MTDSASSTPGNGPDEASEIDPRELELRWLGPLLVRHIGSARWFRGGGATPVVEQVASLPWLTPPGTEPAVRIEMVTVSHGTVTETYQVPVCYRREPLDGAWGPVPVRGLGEVHAHDGAADPDALWVLWQLFSSGRLHLGDESSLQAIRVEALSPDDATTEDADPVPLTGEQSNTSIRYGELAQLKLFRRIEQGRNLELERLLGMQQKAPVAPDEDPAPRLLGWFEADWVDGDHQVWADLGVLTELVSPAFDGWDQAVQHCVDGNDFGPGAGAIGAALARLHRRLARLSEPARRPYATVLAEIAERTGQTIDAVGALTELAPSIRSTLQELATRDDDGEIAVQQLHGDFHLGQVLFEPPGGAPAPRARIIDFEGEPMATAEQRRAPGSPARDVAGLLRSLAYARAAAVIGGVDPERAREWQRGAAEAFLAGYRRASAQSDPLPVDVLRAHLIEKAVYEVGYEARHRPDWLPMARLSLAELLDNWPEDTQATTDATTNGGHPTSSGVTTGTGVTSNTGLTTNTVEEQK